MTSKKKKIKNNLVNPNIKSISGPINVVRLEGFVGNIKKVLYLFMDFHISVSNQMQCKNVFSKDVHNFFIDSFYNLNKSNTIYDFFLEIFPSELSIDNNDDNLDKKDKYIEEVVKFFRKIFIYDMEKNKVYINNLFKNIRLHYLDIRDYFKHNFIELLNNINHEMKEISYKYSKNISNIEENLKNIILISEDLKHKIKIIINILKKKNNNISHRKIIKQNSYKMDIKALEYLTYKIKYKYYYSFIKKKMQILINTSIKNFEDIINNIDNNNKYFEKCIKLIKNTDDKFILDNNTNSYNYGLSYYTVRQLITDILNKLDFLIEDKIINYFARFTDIYFLRRFLDKNYITNTIVYSGAAHSIMYIKNLITDFDFKITHYSYSNITDLKKLNNLVKKNNNLNEVQKYFYPKNFSQCSDLTNFPNDFL